MAAGLSVNIAIEQLLESEVEEIARDGQEKYVPQLSMSEQLSKLAHKIDFLSEAKSKADDNADDNDDESDNKTLVTFQPSLWPWDSVRTKLRNALTEVCVLSDLLNVVKEKKYVVLDPVSQSQAISKPTLQLLAKKKNLRDAATILLQGSKRMESAVQERMSQQSRPDQERSDFHSELINLRQRWRLKRTGNSLMGDLTYRSAGSQFWNPGLFEVTKPTGVDNTHGNTPAPSVSGALEVKVSSDLEGVAEVNVQIVESGTDVHMYSGKSKVLAKMNSRQPWQGKLEAAQRNLFCKELFTQLSQEAYSSRGTTTNLVMGNEIRTEVFPGLELCITYSHNKTTSTDEDPTPKDETMSQDPHEQPEALNLHPLEYILHSLLRRRHKQNQTMAPPNPVTAHLIPGTSKKLRLAGPGALRSSEVASSYENEPILNTIISVAKHQILKTKVMEMIGKLSSEVTDPCLQCNWASVSSEIAASAVIHIHAPELQDSGRVSVRLQIGIQEVQATCDDGRSVTCSSHVQDLKDFLLSQVAQHRVLVAHTMAVSLGWHVIHHSNHVATGPVEYQGHAAGLVVTSPDSDRSIAVRAGPSSGISVAVRRPRGSLPDFLSDPKWSLVGSEFVSVDLQSMPGRTFVQKMYLLLGVEMSLKN
ncbi:predicted protein [Nematostella vectensis]|uniref:Mediator of RNA polymerase II transcription subunit 17 n=1 Tax=Nematostella vectensis TaxID=45351 RepID=A7SW38_NEMVE|nr:predicted protein [Nematostella vectensis]|eukprot:XP_001624158.1 predicted protein [Nematostella vectensis]